MAGLQVQPTRARQAPFTINDKATFNKSLLFRDMVLNARGGHLGIFWVGMCRPGLQIATPFENNFPYN